MPIAWKPIVTSLQAALDGTTYGPISYAELTTGAAIRNALSAAGASYDASANDGVSNQSTYAISMAAWAAVASPAWVELDRVARATYQLIPPPSTYAVAAFGVAGLTAWAASTSSLPQAYAANVDAVVPTTANGCNYLCIISGNAGLTEPVWTTGLGDRIQDGSVLWLCVAAITTASGAQPIALPFDITEQTTISLLYRGAAATAQAATNAGMTILIAGAGAAFSAAYAQQPAANPTADALSTSVTNALNAAIANANQWMAAAAVR